MDFNGCEVSVEMGGGLGFYQGRVVSVNSERQTLTITRVLQNGRPAALNEVTVNARDIKDLKIIAPAEGETHKPGTKERPKQKGSQPVWPKHESPTPRVIETTTPKEKQQQQRKPRTSVVETLAHGSHSSNNKDTITEWQQRTNNTDWQQRTNNSFYALQEYSSPRRNDKYGNNRTPGKRDRQRNRDETTFGTPVDDDMLSTEFDFEKNLALFDKQAVIEEIQSLKPDVVRQADRFTEKKYRCDENVLPSKATVKQQITVPTSGAAEIIYANDCGLLVPSVRSELRMELMSTANQHGLTHSRQLEIIGRAATEVILSLSGGNHRLGGGNSHQPPLVVVVCGCHTQGAAGVNTARQLESHGVQTIVVTPQLSASPPPSLLLTHELQLYGLTNGRTTPDAQGISSTVDLIVDARLDHSGRVGVGGHGWLTSVTAWASSARAPILALDPPSDLAAIPSNSTLAARVLMCPALPLAYTPTRGKVYLINVPIPLQTFSAVGIKYVSPFGAKLVIPLHPYE